MAQKRFEAMLSRNATSAAMAALKHVLRKGVGSLTDASFRPGAWLRYAVLATLRWFYSLSDPVTMYRGTPEACVQDGLS